MFALPGILLLVFFIYLRPQEILTDLQKLPLLYVFFALALFGLAVDIRLRVNKASATPQLPWALLLFGWAILSLALSAPDHVLRGSLEFAVSITLFVVVAHSVHTFRAFQLVTGVLLALIVILAFIGVHQGRAPWGCVLIDPDKTGDITIGVPDGRDCRPLEDLDCYLKGEPEPGADYICEHIGLFGTTSVAGRVRYRGVLQDPNELALALSVGMAFAFAFAFAARKRSASRLALVLATVSAVGLCVYLTQSRGGQLVFASVLGVYAVWRWRWKAVVVMLALAPVALIAMAGGGEERVDAAASTEERMEAWATGISLFRSSPLFGVGHGQFVQHHYLTAHNSYVLALAELGIVGFLLWGGVLYLAFKILLTALVRYRDRPDAEVAVAWGLALLASLSGLSVGIFFLSFSWHYVFWIYMGLTGAYYSAIRTHDPEFRVRMGWLDWGVVALVGTLLASGLFVYLRLKGY